jgi:precorrin-6Y C5,15-methyltransferase (decarboxylating)
LGGEREKINDVTANDFVLTATENILALNSVAIEIVAGSDAKIVSLAPGLPDAMFEHDHQITKREIRAMSLSALAPRQGEVLWDIGAGSGSIGIEWMLRHPSNRAFAIEPKAERAARVLRNAVSLGVPDIEVLEGTAPEMLVGLPVPDAIFIGGGGTDAGVFDAAWSALRPGGRLVMNAVTLETQADLIKYHTTLGGELISVQIARADPIGPYHGWRAAMPVTQWSITKPLEPLT